MMFIQEMNCHARKLMCAYGRALMPLSKECGITNTAIALLLFIANNPELATARDICEISGLKRAIVSFHVDRMVTDGYLERKEYPGDRRKDYLVPTEKAQAVIEAGKKVQVEFGNSIVAGLSEDELTVMQRCLTQIDANIEEMIR